MKKHNNIMTKQQQQIRTMEKNTNLPTGYLLLKLSDLRSILGQCVVTCRTCGEEGVRLEQKYKTCFASTLALKCDTCLKKLQNIRVNTARNKRKIQLLDRSRAGCRVELKRLYNQSFQLTKRCKLIEETLKSKITFTNDAGF